jgi:hypothetical protein
VAWKQRSGSTSAQISSGSWAQRRAAYFVHVGPDVQQVTYQALLDALLRSMTAQAPWSP